MCRCVAGMPSMPSLLYIWSATDQSFGHLCWQTVKGVLSRIREQKSKKSKAISRG